MVWIARDPLVSFSASYFVPIVSQAGSLILSTGGRFSLSSCILVSNKYKQQKNLHTHQFTSALRKQLPYTHGIHPQHSRLHTSKENSPTTSNHQTSATMPDHQQPSSSAQAPSGSSNTPASEVAIERFGKVSGDHQQFAGALPAYITIVPDDNEGPLNDQDGNLTSTDLVIGGHMLVSATEENRRQALARGENVDDSTDLMRFLLKMGDRVSLIYSSGSRLIAVKKIN